MITNYKIVIDRPIKYLYNNKLYGSSFKALTTAITDGKIHIDRKVEGLPPRVTLINFPIYPFDMSIYGPTNFFKLIEGSYGDYDNAIFEKQCSVDYKHNLPVIFNLQEYHNAVNDTNDYRFNCQFTTDLEFKDLVELYDNEELFN